MKQTSFASKAPGGGGYSWEFLVGVCLLVLLNLTLFQTKKCHFTDTFSDITFRQKLRHHYLDFTVHKQTNSSNAF